MPDATYNIESLDDIEPVRARPWDVDARCNLCKKLIAKGEAYQEGEGYTPDSEAAGRFEIWHTACHEQERARDVAKSRAALVRELPDYALTVKDLPAFSRRDAEAAQAAVAVGSWLLKDPLPALWLHGPTARGKTTISALALVALQDEAVEAGEVFLRLAFRSAPAVVAKKVEPKHLVPLRGNRLVVLDDVGRHRFTPSGIDRLYRWAEGVNEGGSPLLVTSLLHPLVFAEAVTKATDEPTAAALVSRLTGRGGGMVVEVK